MKSETGYTNGASQMDLFLIRGGCALVSEQKTVSHIHVYHIFFFIPQEICLHNKKGFYTCMDLFNIFKNF